jgi:hypothetical protein
MPSVPVYDAIRAFMDASFSATQVLYENEGDPSGDIWTLIEFSSTTYTQESIGAGTQAANRFDDEGSFFAHVMVKTGTGIRDALAVTDTIANLFRGLTLLNGSVEFNDVVVGYGGMDEEGKWYRTSVSIGWRQIDSRRP